MNRRLRTTIPTIKNRLKPKCGNLKNTQRKMKQQKMNQKQHYDKSSKPLPELQPNDTIRFQHNPKGKWDQGTVVRNNNTPNSYVIETPEGQIFKRNRKHLLKTKEDKIEQTSLEEGNENNHNDFDNITDEQSLEPSFVRRRYEHTEKKDDEQYTRSISRNGQANSCVSIQSDNFITPQQDLVSNKTRSLEQQQAISNQPERSILLPVDVCGTVKERQEIVIRYYRERLSKYSEETSTISCSSIRQCKDITSFDEPVAFDEVYNGFSICRMQIGGKDFIDTKFERIDGILKKTTRYPSVGVNIDGIIIHEALEIWGYDEDNLLMIGLVIGTTENVLYTWFNDNVMISSGSMNIIVVTEPGIYSCEVSEETKLNMDIKARDKPHIMKQVVQAVSYMHSLEPMVLHHDIKPGNILIRKGCLTTKVCDMGISRLKSVGAATTTAVGSTCGSLAYMARECLLRQENTSPSTDIWSLGVTFIEFFTEKDAWSVDDELDPVAAIKDKMKQEVSPVAQGLATLFTKKTYD
ncbi:unnamed protein product [Mytilus coruscus]|uniref:Protein kinase domain-containing protein n=1 Tax=Mytilus coruscus TaxID=42192 RepID=A0A6J8AWY2_MYTCO|nr:unnamed protein product [Mytilus coruscus]